uniref:PDZ domain-containing protein n=1 Tax=Panagrolaimus sp. PS1159 TaxID=55785 RepID=A0AC35F1Q1_9BILA
RLQVIRDEKRAEELEAKVHIPAERSKYIQRRDGFVYNMVKIEWKPGGPKLGLGIKHYQNRVLVSRCDPGSLAAQQLAIGDHIIDIDGKIVSDKDVARDFLLKSLQAQGFVTCVVERPESYEAKHWTQQALTANAAQPPSVAMNSDVRDIAARERIKMKERNAAAKKPGILGRTQKSGRVQIGDKIAEFVIASDNEGKNLRSVRK